jgi:hypothetical protein
MGVVGVAAAGAAAAAAAGVAAATHSAAKSIDDVAKTASKLGATTEGLVGIQHAGEIAGVAIKQTNKGLQQMTRQVSEAAAGTGEAVDALKALGLDAKTLNSLPIEDKFSAIADAMNKVGLQSDKVSIASDIFGARGGVALLNVMSMGADGLNKMSAEAKRLGITFSGVEARGVESAMDALNRSGKAVRGTFIRLAVRVAPAIQSIADTFTSTVISIRSSVGDFSGVFDVIKAGAMAVGNGIRTAASVASIAWGEVRGVFLAVLPALNDADSAIKMLGNTFAIASGAAKVAVFGILRGVRMISPAVLLVARSIGRSVQAIHTTTLKAVGRAITDTTEMAAGLARAFGVDQQTLDDLTGLGNAMVSVGDTIDKTIDNAIDSFPRLQDAIDEIDAAGLLKSGLEDIAAGRAGTAGEALLKAQRESAAAVDSVAALSGDIDSSTARAAKSMARIHNVGEGRAFRGSLMKMVSESQRRAIAGVDGASFASEAERASKAMSDSAKQIREAFDGMHMAAVDAEPATADGAGDAAAVRVTAIVDPVVVPPPPAADVEVVVPERRPAEPRAVVADGGVLGAAVDSFEDQSGFMAGIAEGAEASILRLGVVAADGVLGAIAQAHDTFVAPFTGGDRAGATVGRVADGTGLVDHVSGLVSGVAAGVIGALKPLDISGTLAEVGKQIDNASQTQQAQVVDDASTQQRGRRIQETRDRTGEKLQEMMLRTLRSIERNGSPSARTV